MNKNVKKVPAAATLPCKYRGKWIECPVKDFTSNLCEYCGFNPDVEAERKKKLK